MLSPIKKRGLIFAFGGVLLLFYSEHSRFTEISLELRKLKKMALNMFEEEIEDYYEDKVTSFYMYSPEDYPLLAEYDRCVMAKDQHYLKEYATQRIGGEVYFMRQLISSSWRTSDMEHAALIVVPIYFGIMGRYGKCRKEAELFLSNITLTKKHVLFTVEWMNIDLRRYCTECIHMLMYTHPSRPTCEIPAPLSSQLESSWNTKSNSTNSSSLVDWTNRKYAYYFGGCADNRPNYKTRRRFPGTFERIKNNITTGFVQSYVSGYHSSSMDPNFVERMLNTKFGIHWVGDNPISNRVFEWIQVESFLVILADGFYDQAATGTHIPWRNFTIQIKETSTDVELDSQLIEISNLPEELIQQKVKIMKRFAKRLLWNMPGSKVAETLLIDAVEKCT